MSVVCAEARGTVTHRTTVTTGVVVRRARVRRRDAGLDQCCCASRLFACSASFARTNRLSDSSEAAARTAVRAKSAKVAKAREGPRRPAKAREEPQPQEWWFGAPASAGAMLVSISFAVLRVSRNCSWQRTRRTFA